MKKKKYLSFLFAFLMGFTVDFVGKLFMAEILAIVSLPSLKIRRLLKYIPKLKNVLICLAILLLALIISDILNSTEPEDYLRGWALIIFAGISSVFLINQFIADEKNIIYFLLGVFIVKLFFGEAELGIQYQEVSTNYFKERLVGFVNAAVLIVSYILMKSKKRKIVILLFLIYTLLCFILDARSNGLAFFLTTFLLGIKFYNIKLSKAKISISVIFFIIVFYGLYVFYVDAVLNSGFGGSNAYNQLSNASNPYNPFELIYQGRTDFFVLIEAVKDKPIFGHGSWGKDPNFKYSKLLQLFSDSNELIYRNYISAHSVILGFWAYAGLLGAVSISLLYFNVLKLFIRIFSSRIIENVFPILVFISLKAFWHFFFSPIQEMRFSFPFFIAVVLSTSYRLKLLRK